MATIVERPRKNKPSTWQATVRVKGQQTVTKTFETRDKADEFAQRVECELKKLALIEEKRKARLKPKQASLEGLLDESLVDILEKYLDSSDSPDRQKRNLPTIIKFVRRIGGNSLHQITSSWNKKYVERLRREKTNRKTAFSYATIFIHLQIMANACKWRAESLNIPTPELNFSKKHFPKHWENKRSRRLSAEEQIRLEATLAKHGAPSKTQWLLLMRLALETGARLQELVLADWAEFELPRKLWTIPAAKTKCNKERAVPLSSLALDYMRELESEALDGNTRVFHRLGQPLSVSAGFHKFVKKTGLIDFRFHDLRHEAISRMVLYKRKLSVFEIMAIVGHSDLSMLVRYANLRGDELAERMD